METQEKLRDQTDSLPRRMGITMLARLVLVFEDLTRRYWVTVAAMAGFLGLAFIGFFDILNPWVHSLLLAGFTVAIGYSVWKGFKAPETWHDEDILTRIEDDSDLSDRPLESLSDELQLGHNDPVAKALWHEHRKRLRKSIHDLTVNPPRPQIAKLDPWALRFIPITLFIVGLALGWGNLGERLASAISPNFVTDIAEPWEAEIWITPPVYTGQSPVYFKTSQPLPESPIPVPEGSLLLAQASFLNAPVSIAVGDQISEMSPLGRDNRHQLETTVEAGGHISLIHKGDILVTLPIDLQIDEPPNPEFPATPSGASGARLRVDFMATDDYGVTEMQAVIRRENDEATLMLDLPLARVGATEVRGRSFFDLAAHPWAGLPVSISLLASDSRSQNVESERINILMPERIFNHPIAQRLSENRKKLADPSVEVIYDVVDSLEVILQNPKQFFDDIVVFMGLRFAAERLLTEPSSGEISDIRGLFWDLALRIEDGEVVLAERKLRDAQEKLLEAMTQGADQAELDQLMRDVEAAIEDFLQALAQSLEERGIDPNAPLPGGETVASEDLLQMMQRARELAEAGDIQGAQQMMANVQQMLDDIQSAMRDGSPQDPFQSEAQQMMKNLRDLSSDQRSLLDETFQDMQAEERRREEEIMGRQFRQPDQAEQSQNQGAGNPDPSNARPGEDGEQATQSGEGQAGGQPGNQILGRQNQLRRELGDAMRQMDELLGSIPQPLGEADQAMRRAEDALERGDSGAAVGPQGQALEHLREATNQLSEQMAQRAQSQSGMQIGRSQGPGQGRDPFGRNPSGSNGMRGTTDGAMLPEQGEIQRAQEILQELRRRSGDYSRPQIERDYIDRLLRRF